MTVIIDPVAKTSQDEHTELKQLEAEFDRLTLHSGFMQRPNIPSELAASCGLGLAMDLGTVHYFIGHIDLLHGLGRHRMSTWRERLFIRMASNMEDITASYQIPPAQAMTVGQQVGIGTAPALGIHALC